MTPQPLQQRRLPVASEHTSHAEARLPSTAAEDEEDGMLLVRPRSCGACGARCCASRAATAAACRAAPDDELDDDFADCISACGYRSPPIGVGRSGDSPVPPSGDMKLNALPILSSGGAGSDSG